MKAAATTAPAPFDPKYFPSKVAQSVDGAAECFKEINDVVGNPAEADSIGIVDAIELNYDRAKLLVLSLTTPSYMKWEGDSWKKGVEAWEQWKMVLQTIARDHKGNDDKYRLIGQLYTDGFMQGLLDEVVAPIIDSKIRLEVLVKKDPQDRDADLKAGNLIGLNTGLQLTLKKTINDFQVNRAGPFIELLEQLKKAIKDSLRSVLEGDRAKEAMPARNAPALGGKAVIRLGAALVALPLLAYEPYRGWVADGFSSQSEVDITTAKNALAALPCEKPGSTPS